MGAVPWNYITAYDDDIESVLQKLRKQEFESGRYNGDSQGRDGKGARHDSIDDALEDAGADGTCSILDIQSVSLQPDDGLEQPLCGIAYPLPNQKLLELFGTERPSRNHVESRREIYSIIGRGCCIYIPLYEDGAKSSHIFWAGYSYD